MISRKSQKDGRSGGVLMDECMNERTQCFQNPPAVPRGQGHIFTLQHLTRGSCGCWIHGQMHLLCCLLSCLLTCPPHPGMLPQVPPCVADPEPLSTLSPPDLREAQVPTLPRPGDGHQLQQRPRRELGEDLHAAGPGEHDQVHGGPPRPAPSKQAAPQGLRGAQAAARRPKCARCAPPCCGPSDSARFLTFLPPTPSERYPHAPTLQMRKVRLKELFAVWCLSATPQAVTQPSAACLWVPA